MPLTKVFKLTPRFKNFYNDSQEWINFNYNVWAGLFTGVFGAVSISYSPPGSDTLGTLLMIAENYEDLYNDDKLFLVANHNHENDTSLDEWWKEAGLSLSVVIDPTTCPLEDGTQMVLSFDVQSYHSNIVQLFVGDELIEEYSVKNRRKMSILVDPFIQLYVIIRLADAGKELYFYSVECGYL